TNLAKKLSWKLGSSYNNFLQSWYQCYNSYNEPELENHWKDLLIRYPQLWAIIYVFANFCARMQSTQWVESTNGLIKAEVGAKTTLHNLGKAIQMKLEYEA
ncbi:43256_t:CDS:2, partial [Gigaspora margarita]